MTAHRAKPVTLTPEIVALFADYHRRESAWGVLHCSLADSNYGPAWGGEQEWEVAERAQWTDEERILVRLHDSMTVSQRTRLRRKVDEIVTPRAGIPRPPT